MTPEEVRSARFSRSLWRGYQRVGVHELLDRAAIQMEAHQSPSVLIASTPLELERRGYRRHEVDCFLSDLATGGGAVGQERSSQIGKAAPRRRWFSWRDIVGLYIVLSIVGAIFRGSWVGYAVGGLVLATFLVMIAWRRRSGIETWTFMSTIAGLVTRVRPTRAGLVGPDRFQNRGSQPAHESFDAMAHRLHED